VNADEHQELDGILRRMRIRSRLDGLAEIWYRLAAQADSPWSSSAWDSGAKAWDAGANVWDGGAKTWDAGAVASTAETGCRSLEKFKESLKTKGGRMIFRQRRGITRA
jgi:hypothetical protein